MLLIEVSVLRVAVAQRLPARLQVLLVQRPRLVRLAHVLQQRAHVVDRDQRARVAVAQRLPLRLQRLLVQRPRLVRLAHGLQQHGHVADRGQRARVAVAQRLLLACTASSCINLASSNLSWAAMSLSRQRSISPNTITLGLWQGESRLACGRAASLHRCQGLE